jgi:hypothetical protein
MVVASAVQLTCGTRRVSFFLQTPLPIATRISHLRHADTLPANWVIRVGMILESELEYLFARDFDLNFSSWDEI